MTPNPATITTTSSASCFLICIRESPFVDILAEQTAKPPTSARLGQPAGRAIQGEHAAGDRGGERLIGGHGHDGGAAAGRRRTARARRSGRRPRDRGRRSGDPAGSPADRAPARARSARACAIAASSAPTGRSHCDEGMSSSRASSAARLATSSGNGSMSSVNGNREILQQRQRLEQHGALGHDAETVDDGQPLGAVGDRGRGLSEHRSPSPRSGSDAPVTRFMNTSAIGWSRPSKRDVLAGRNGQLVNAERAKAAVALGDAGELEGRRVHEPIRRLTSSTTRADTVSASISIFTAATFAAIAAYAIIAWMIGGITPGVDARADDRRRHRDGHRQRGDREHRLSRGRDAGGSSRRSGCFRPWRP